MKSSTHTLIITGLIFIAALSRLLPHAPNFTPVIGMFLFSAWMFDSRSKAILAGFVAIAVSDLLIGPYSGMWGVYLSYACVFAYASLLKTSAKTFVSRLVQAAGGSLVFFVTSNFSVWALSGMYPKNLAGLQACYVAALPFFYNTLISTVMTVGVLVGAYRMAEKLVFDRGEVKA